MLYSYRMCTLEQREIWHLRPNQKTLVTIRNMVKKVFSEGEPVDKAVHSWQELLSSIVRTITLPQCC